METLYNSYEKRMVKLKIRKKYAKTYSFIKFVFYAAFLHVFSRKYRFLHAFLINFERIYEFYMNYLKLTKLNPNTTI